MYNVYAMPFNGLKEGPEERESLATDQKPQVHGSAFPEETYRAYTALESDYAASLEQFFEGRVNRLAKGEDIYIMANACQCLGKVKCARCGGAHRKERL